MLITSSQNSELKKLRAFYKDKKAREQENVFICEGANLVKDIPENFHVDSVFVKESKENDFAYLAEKFDVEISLVNDDLFDSVCNTVTPSGVVAVVKKPENKTVNGDIVLLLDGISDSGNMGTIIRSAAGRGIKSVLAVDCTDAFSPKAVRAGMSGHFFTDIIECDRTSVFELLKGYEIVGLDMGGKSIFDYSRMDRKIVIAVGSEAHGLSEEIRKAASDILAIPMDGEIESLNAAVSISIAMFAIR